MQVILTQDVAKIGKKQDVVTVADGYAHNFLIPNGKAIQASKNALAHHKKHQEEKTEMTNQETERMHAALVAQSKTPVVITAKANEKGNLFKKLYAADLADALSAACGVTIPESAIAHTEPIAAVGDVEISVMFNEGKLHIPFTINAE